MPQQGCGSQRIISERCQFWRWNRPKGSRDKCFDPAASLCPHGAGPHHSATVRVNDGCSAEGALLLRM